jgi:hypothetical protein
MRIVAIVLFWVLPTFCISSQSFSQTPGADTTIKSRDSTAKKKSKTFSLGSHTWGLGFGDFDKYSGLRFGLSKQATERSNGIDIALLNRTRKSKGIQIGVLLIDGQSNNGISAGLMNMSDSGTRNGIVGGIGAGADRMNGLLAGLYVGAHRGAGVLAGMITFLGEERDSTRKGRKWPSFVGIQVGFISTAAQSFTGAMLGAFNAGYGQVFLQAGFSNTAFPEKFAMQVGPINNGGGIFLSQVGIVNMNHRLPSDNNDVCPSKTQPRVMELDRKMGAQIGIVNLSKARRQFQIGLVNKSWVSDSGYAVQIGLINIIKRVDIHENGTRYSSIRVIPFFNCRKGRRMKPV